jgi:ADP-ribosyltransferase exoenzyme
MPKYAQNASAIKHEGKQVGFIAKLPGPMKKSTGKTHAIFDIYGNKVSHANGLEEGKHHLQVAGKMPGTPSAPVIKQVVTHAEPSRPKLGPVSDDVVQQLVNGYSLAELNDMFDTATNPHMKSAIGKALAQKSQVKSDMQIKREAAIKELVATTSLSDLEAMHATSTPGSTMRDSLAKAIWLKKSQTPDEPKPETPMWMGKPQAVVKQAYSPTYGAQKELPKYAKNGYKYNGFTIATLPAPMKKSSGHSYAVFNPQGHKVGYAHSYSDAKQLAEGKGGLTPSEQVKQAKVGMGHGISSNAAHGTLLAHTQNTARRNQQKEAMSLNQRTAWGRYTDGVYHQMNAYLRGEQTYNPHGSQSELVTDINHLIAAFSAVGFKTTQEDIVHRGTGHFAYYGNVGDIIVAKGFTSTAASPSSSFGGNKLKIKLQVGQSYILGTQGEREIILPPNTKLKVLAVDGQGKVTDVEAIPS